MVQYKKKNELLWKQSNNTERNPVITLMTAALCTSLFLCRWEMAVKVTKGHCVLTRLLVDSVPVCLIRLWGEAIIYIKKLFDTLGTSTMQ